MKIDKQILNFIKIGIINTLFYYMIYSCLIYTSFNYKLSVLIATIIGVLFSFKTFGKYVFDNRDNKLIFKFMFSYGVLYFMNIYLIDMFLFLNKYIAGFIALLPITILTYMFNKYFVFNNNLNYLGVLKMIRIDKKLLELITDVENERNIYVHPLALARDIFWQRLEYAFEYIKKYTNENDDVLDFGGGSGVFAKALTSYFKNVSLIDLDTKDADSIKKYFKLDNLNIITENINTFQSDQKFNLIIATDVLEHFQNLSEPLNFFNKFLLKDGFLLVTLPTENKIYEFGRLVINKSKPKDHYHRSDEVLKFLIENKFSLIEKQFLPKYIIPIPLFEVAILQFNGNSNE